MLLFIRVWALLVLVNSAAVCQYAITWPTAPSNPLASNLEPSGHTLVVRGINDFLYTYRFNEIETQQTLSPQQPNSSKGAAAMLVACPSEVTTYKKDADDAAKALLSLYPPAGSPSVSLTSSQKDWSTKVAAIYNKLGSDQIAAQNAFAASATPTSPTCKTPIDQANTEKIALDKADTLLNQGPHQASVQFDAKSCKSNAITISEFYRGNPTGQSITATLNSECDQFSASGGVLLSEVQNRTYTSTPSVAGTGNVLAVGGMGKLTPTLISLFNFNFPEYFPAKSKVFGFGISTGPVLQLSSSQASAFGWFAGFSVSVWKYLFISAGEHFAQFAYYPQGFTTPGQTVPSGFSTLTPVKGQTARFGFAISIKGWDISKGLGSGTQPAPTSNPQTPGVTTAKATGGS